MTDIKIPKSWKELESENAQLRAARDKLSEEVDSLTEEVEKQGDANVRLASELEEARGIIRAAHDTQLGMIKLAEKNSMPHEALDMFEKKQAAWLASHPADRKR